MMVLQIPEQLELDFRKICERMNVDPDAETRNIFETWIAKHVILLETEQTMIDEWLPKKIKTRRGTRDP